MVAQQDPRSPIPSAAEQVHRTPPHTLRRNRSDLPGDVAWQIHMHVCAYGNVCIFKIFAYKDMYIYINVNIYIYICICIKMKYKYV